MLGMWLWFVGDAEAGLRIAVVEFTNAADDHDLDALGKGLQSMLTTDLSGVQQVELVERSRLTEIQDELKLAQQNWVDPATAAKVGKLAGASTCWAAATRWWARRCGSTPGSSTSRAARCCSPSP